MSLHAREQAANWQKKKMGRKGSAENRCSAAYNIARIC
jgi:hypothetical protein